MIDLEKRIIEFENRVETLEKDNGKLKNETVEAVVNKLSELNIQLQQFQKDTINSCIDNMLKCI